MKLLAKVLPILFFLLLFALIGLIISGFWVRNQKITQIPQNIIDTATSIFASPKEIEDLTPDSGYAVNTKLIEVEIKNLDENNINLITNKEDMILQLTPTNMVAKTTLNLNLGVNIFTLTQIDPIDYSIIKEVPFIYYHTEAETNKEVAIFGKVISTLGGNVELKSLISGNSFTLATNNNTSFEFVNPREENDGNKDQGLKDIERLEVDDIVIGFGAVSDSVQTTQKLISYANKDPLPKVATSLKSGEISSVDTKKETFSLKDSKTKYYWDKNTTQNNNSPIPPQKGQKILFHATANSYGNLIVRNILSLQ